jgi:broad specificity phosphatase PhoE
MSVGRRITLRESRLLVPEGHAGFDDVLWAATDFPPGPYAALARRIRRGLRDVGDGLAGRLQRARILALCHGATAEEKIAILACLHAGARRAAYPVMASDDLRLLRTVDLVFDALAAAEECLDD